MTGQTSHISRAGECPRLRWGSVCAEATVNTAVHKLPRPSAPTRTGSRSAPVLGVSSAPSWAHTQACECMWPDRGPRSRPNFSKAPWESFSCFKVLCQPLISTTRSATSGSCNGKHTPATLSTNALRLEFSSKNKVSVSSNKDRPWSWGFLSKLVR